MEFVDTGIQRALTLISAPAGFGKTTLLTHWATHTGLPIAWFSIDEGDNDPFRFMAYLIAALDSVVPTVGDQFQGAFLSLQLTIQPIVAGLINHLSTVEDEIVLVLDDYQFIHSPEIHKALAFLLEKIPPCLHIVISTRTDPPFPLARLRARDQLVELRAADLRFSLEESAGFLKQVMSLDLSHEDISALDARTEGWIAGLQMAALSIRTMVAAHPAKELSAGDDGNDVSSFIKAFSGSNRYILDYLGEEVITHRTEDIRRFLLQTSILERFSGQLCDAVTGTDGSQSVLEELEKENLFLVPLDNERHWYRYHHLFAELLRYQLDETLSKSSEAERGGLTCLAELHLRAADWFEKEKLVSEAVQHFTAARKFDRAATLIEAQAHQKLYITGQAYTLSEWLAALPPGLFRSRPRLNIAKAWTLISQSQYDAAYDPLEAAWQAVQERQDADAASLSGEIAVVRGVLAQLSNRDVEEMREQALLLLEGG